MVLYPIYNLACDNGFYFIVLTVESKLMFLAIILFGLSGLKFCFLELLTVRLIIRNLGVFIHGSTGIEAFFIFEITILIVEY